MKKFIQFTAGIALFALTAFLLTQVDVSAQSTGLRINPRADLTIRPGETQSGTLLVANLNDNVDVTIDLNIVDFRANGETGTPSPILEENAEPTPWSLKSYITVPKSVNLKKGETKYVPYSVRIPEGQGAGSYYSAIKYDPKPIDSDDRVVISGAPMQLVFVTVPGKATELMNLEKFGTYSMKDSETSGKYQSLFIGGQPERMAYLLRNAGNVAESPTGSIVIKNLFGKKIHVIESANPKSNLALIDQTRRFDVCIDSEEVKVEQEGGRTDTKEKCKSPGFWPGMYTAELNLFYGINGSSTQEINAKAVFWYLPWWSIAIIVGVLAILAFVIFMVRRSLIGTKSHKRKAGRR